MTSLPVQNVNPLVFGSLSVSYTPITGGSGTDQFYQMWNSSSNEAMYVSQGATPADLYDIKRDTSNGKWSDVGSGLPTQFEVSSSTSPSTPQTTSGWTNAPTSSDKYLHIFAANGNHIGYIDVWTPFQSSSGGGSGASGNTTSTNMEISNVVFTQTSDTTLKLELDYANLASNEEIRIRKVHPSGNVAWFDQPLGGSGSLDSTDAAFSALQTFLNVPSENGTRIYFMSKYEVIDAPGSRAGNIRPYSSVPNHLAYTEKGYFFRNLFIDWSIVNLNGKPNTVVAKCFGVQMTNPTRNFDMQMSRSDLNVTDHWSSHLVATATSWTGNELTMTLAYEPNVTYGVHDYDGQTSSGIQAYYGSTYTTKKSTKVFHNFW